MPHLLTRPVSRSFGVACVFTLLSASAWAVDHDTLGDAITDGKFHFESRARYEHVDQANLAKTANAKTSYVRTGYETGSFHGASILGEIESINHWGYDNFNSSINGHTQYPRVNDPNDLAINRLYLMYQGPADTTINLGRFRQAFDNQRWVGNSNWRQNDSSYDGVSFHNQSFKDTSLDYVFINKVHRTSGTNSPVGTFSGDIHLMHASHKFSPLLDLTGYSYLLGMQGFAANLDSQTYGIRASGAYPIADTDFTLTYTAEGANQSDYANSHLHYSEMYWRFEPGISYKKANYKVIYEVLGGNGTAAVQTPLASLHQVNGWADQFGTTPNNGLEDLYFDFSYTPSFHPMLEGTRIIAQIHDYNANVGGQHYGNEWGFGAEKKFDSHWLAGIRYADYHADSFAVDTTKSWAYVSYIY